jgi:predicted AAA+ superfamily ATPase
MIKIITGLRRSGKSYLLFQLYKNYLLQQGVLLNHIITIDLEDYNQSALHHPKNLLKHIDSQINSQDWYYIFIDEVQHLKQFEDVLNTLLKRGNLDVYVTGSNARFLSKDVVTTFRGRGDEIHIHPFSFQEFASAKSDTPYQELLREYMIYGGLPQLCAFATEEQKESYLKALFTETYLKDIRERYNILDDGDMEELIDIIASSIGSMQNPLKLQNTFKSVKQSNITSDTIKRYLDHLQDAFLIEKSLRFDIKGKRYISTPQKYYFEDLGLRNARLNFRQFEPTHLLENMLYNELRIRGFSVDVGQVITHQKDEKGVSQRQTLEVDFVCNRGNKRCYIQSAYSMPSYDKIQQELKSLMHIHDNFIKVIVTADLTPTHYMDNGVLVINLQDFLTKEDSLPL